MTSREPREICSYSQNRTLFKRCVTASARKLELSSLEAEGQGILRWKDEEEAR
jgi:hypothetical protein